MRHGAFSLSSLLVTLLCISRTILAQSNQFINPPVPGPDNVYSANNVYAVGSTINLQWTTNYTTMSLVMWQNDNATFQYLSKMVPAVSTLAWTVDLQGQFNLDDGNVFFFMIFDESGSGDRFSSHYFNITEGATASTTSSTSAAITPTSTATLGGAGTTSTSATAYAASTTSATSAAAATSTLNADQQNAISLGTKIGIGVGVGVGVGCLLAGLAIGIMLRRKRSNGYKAAMNPANGYQPHPSPSQQPLNMAAGYEMGGVQQEYYQDHKLPHQAYQQPMEMSSERPMHELAGHEAQELPASRK